MKDQKRKKSKIKLQKKAHKLIEEKDLSKQTYAAMTFYCEEDECWVSQSLTTHQLGTGSTPAKSLKDMQHAVNIVIDQCNKEDDVILYVHEDDIVEKMQRSLNRIKLVERTI